MSSSPIIFILGAGPGIGQSVAKAFAAKGYKVAVAARSLESGVDQNGYLSLKIDLSKTVEVEKAFDTVREKLGIPTVVVYNAAYRVPRDPEDPLGSIDVEGIKDEFATNAISSVIAAQQAVKGFKQLPSSASRTYIHTGNALNQIVIPAVLTFGMAKNAAAAMIKFASVAYAKQGFKFYFADERQSDGGPTIPVGGPAAGRMYVELAENPEQGPWDYTFVDGKGYVDFQ